jgi:2-C-methyl-D-erythritol 2,4-cyclodiphosphate synthase
MSCSFRIGLGTDTHRLEPGFPLIIGGVEIPHHNGFVAHSDGDVLTHAVIDALLGAAAMRDIGYHFPDSDKKWKDADSIDLLKHVMKLLKQKDYKVSNLDCTVHAQQPKLSSYIPKMISKLSNALALDESCINIKAKTGEKIGFIGKEEGIHAQAVVLIYQ